MVRKSELWIERFLDHIDDPTASVWGTMATIKNISRRPHIASRIFMQEDKKSFLLCNFYLCSRKRIASDDRLYLLKTGELLDSSTGYVTSLNWARDKSLELEDPNNRERAVDPVELARGRVF